MENHPFPEPRGLNPGPGGGDGFGLDVKGQHPAGDSYLRREKHRVVTVSRCGIDRQVPFPENGGGFAMSSDGGSFVHHGDEIR